jgi:hypothetical protein
MPRARTVTRGRVVKLRTEDQELTVILNEMPDEEVRCRMGKHDWALDSVLPGEAWPDIVRAWPGRLGVFRIEDPCLRCGLAWRVFDTLPDAELDADAKISIHYDPDWVKVPQGYDRRKRRIRREYNRRSGKKQAVQVRRAVTRTAATERRAARDAAGAPAVKFSAAGAG